MKTHVMVCLRLGVALGLLACGASGWAQVGSAFTYQGELKETGQPKAGTVDLRFDAFALDSGGVPLNAQPEIRDAVLLDRGRFTVQIDFGPTVFTGAPVFVEVGVREDALGDGSNTTGFTPLLPRQSVTATPYALHAAGVAQNAIGGSQIANSSISSVDVQDGSLIAADLNTTRELEGLQRRVSGGCQAARAAIRTINDDGTIQCIYLDTPSALAAVALDSTGDVGEHVSAHSDRSIIAAAYYDRTNSRLKYVRCVGAGVGSSCAAPIVIDDAVGRDVGQFAALSVSFTNARIAYYDATGGDLKLAVCDNASCTGTIAIRTLDSTGDVGRFASITRNDFDQGNVAVAYFDATNNIYKLARCQDNTCTTNQVTTLSGFPGGGVSGSAVAIATSDGAGPRILLLESGSQARLIRCVNALCNFNNTAVTVSTTARAPLALHTSRGAVPSGEAPLWIGFTDNSGSLRFHQCDDTSCNSGRAVSRAGFNAGLGTTLSLMLRPERLPIAVGIDAGSTVNTVNFEARARLPNTSSVDNPISAAGVARSFVSAAQDDNGSVGVFYHDANDDLIYQRCLRADCSDQ